MQKNEKIKTMRNATADPPPEGRAGDAPLRGLPEESDERYRSLFENMLNGFAYCRMLYDDGKPQDFIYLAVNRAFGELTGLVNVVGKKVTEVVPGLRQSNPELLEIYGRVAATGKPERFEAYVDVLKNWFSVSVYSPEKEHFVAVFDVVTERKRAEESLRESEARFSTVFHNSPVAIVISGLDDGTFFDVNDAFLSSYGYSREEAIGRTSRDLNLWVHPEEREAMVGILRETGRVRNLEAKFRKKSGEIGDLLISAERIELNGEARLLGMFTDITDRKRMEEELRTAAQQWNNTFDAINDAISIMDERGGVLRMNKAMIDLVDQSPADVVNHPCWEAVHHADGRAGDCPFIKMRKSLRRESMVLRHRTRWFHVIADPILDQAGRLAGGVHIMTDITEHRRFEEQLRESESKFRSLAEQSLVGIYIIQDSVFKYVNPRFAGMFGYPAEEIVDRMGPADLAVPEDRRLIERAAQSQAPDGDGFSHYEARGLKKSGDVIHAEVFGSRAYYQGRPAVIGIVLDVTEKKKLESQLRQAQKMEAVGQLTSGIAHDFNNILSAIIGYASLARMKTGPDDPGRPYLDQILASTDRAASLTRSLLTFSRKQITNLQPVDLNENIRRVRTLLHRIIGEDIDLRTELAPGDLIVNADAGQIEQVLMNLATNARDAMQHGGILSIETAVTDADELPGTAAVAQQRYARVTVTDTGVGMDEKTREKIFEPFFTTKDLGRGTGLGLSMVYGIIRQHNGHIHCYSEPRMGTTFKIYLPLLSAGGIGRKKKEEEEPSRNELRGAETILVIEDDETLRELAKATLEDFGYTVVTAGDGRDGVEQFLRHRDAVRLVLCDVIMPRMSGSEVRDAIRKKAPGVTVLFMSGYPADIMRQKSMLEEGTEVVLKPVSPLVLLKKVREKLDEKKREVR